MSEPQANVALFVPAGALLAVALLRPLLAAAVCALGSTAIEWTQLEWVTTRVADVNDVVHNGLGGLVGAMAAAPVVWWLRRRARAARSTLPPQGPALVRREAQSTPASPTATGNTTRQPVKATSTVEASTDATAANRPQPRSSRTAAAVARR